MKKIIIIIVLMLLNLNLNAEIKINLNNTSEKIKFEQEFKEANADMNNDKYDSAFKRMNSMILSLKLNTSDIFESWAKCYGMSLKNVNLKELAPDINLVFDPEGETKLNRLYNNYISNEKDLSTIMKYLLIITISRFSQDEGKNIYRNFQKKILDEYPNTDIGKYIYIEQIRGDYQQEQIIKSYSDFIEKNKDCIFIDLARLRFASYLEDIKQKEQALQVYLDIISSKYACNNDVVSAYNYYIENKYGMDVIPEKADDIYNKIMNYYYRKANEDVEQLYQDYFAEMEKCSAIKNEDKPTGYQKK